MSISFELQKLTNLYLELLKRSLSGFIQEDPSISTEWRPVSQFDPDAREAGRDWPSKAQTMIGLKRLDNIQYCLEQVIKHGIPGDFIETGVWRGGACIFARGVLKAYGVHDRNVWLSDSFQGFPQNLSHDADWLLASQPDQSNLAVQMDEVVRNFSLYDLLDDQVRFIPGWFKDTLPGPVKQVAVLRLDGDLFVSTMDALNGLYPLLQPGGFCIVDDWNVKMCRAAVDKYRAEHGIEDDIMDIDGHSVFWRKGE